MCGILGIFNHEKAREKIILGLEELKTRGKDELGIISIKKENNEEKIKEYTEEEIKKSSNEETGKNILAHALHAIVGHEKQPIKEKGIIAANCEIYNWKELKKEQEEKQGKKINARNDAHTLLIMLDQTPIKKEAIKETLKKLDGDYAFIYYREEKIIIARDLIGVKPIFYTNEKGFAAASEKKILIKAGYKEINELNPRKIIIYDLKTNKTTTITREFYTIKEKEYDEEEATKRITKKIREAIKKRIPNKKIKTGILFSGGVDSTIIAKICQEQGLNFKCYTAIVDNPLGEEPHDLKAAKKAAKNYGFKHEIIKVKKEEIPSLATETIKLIEETDPVKVAVGMPFLAAAKKAAKEGCKVILSGLGAEELFAGYQRHKRSNNINKECLSGLLWLHERDLYRDDVITMKNGLELRVPFLDKELIKEALTIKGELKIKNGTEKYILRKAAINIGLKEEDAFRPKKAAQYGSRFDRELQKIARKKGMKRAEYLKNLMIEEGEQQNKKKLALLCSGGKDSWYAAQIMKKKNYEITGILVIKSKNPHSYMFHTPTINLVKEQAKASQLPIIEQETKGEKEEELKDLKKLLEKAKKKLKIEGVITGALYSEYQRSRIEKICDELGLKAHSPLWHLDQEKELREIIREGFKICITAIAAEGLNKNWLGKTITEEDINELVRLNKKIGINVAGEGGEYETLVLDSPMFKEEIIIEEYEKIMDNENTGRIIIKKIRRRKKQKT